MLSSTRSAPTRRARPQPLNSTAALLTLTACLTHAPPALTICTWAVRSGTVCLITLQLLLSHTPLPVDQADALSW